MSAQTDGAATRRGPMGGHGPGHGMMPGEKPKDFKGTLKKMIGFMGRFKAALVVVLVFAIGSTVFNIVGPKVLSTATTELFNGIVAKIDGSGGINFDAIAQILLFTLGLYLLSAACSFVQGWIMSSVSQRTSYELRRSIAEKIDRMPMGYFERNSVGDTLSRITNDVDTLGQSLNQGVTQLITSATTIVGVVIMMLTINPLLTGITVLILPVSLALIFTVVKASQKHFRAQQAMLGAINGQVEETFSGHAIVRAFNREQTVAETFGKTNAKLYESAWKSQFLSGLMQPIMNFVGNLGYVGVALAGSVLAVQGVITVGDIQAFIQYVKNFTQPITQLTQVSNVLQCGGLEMDLNSRCVSRDGRELQLSAKEFAVLEYLLRNQGVVLARETIENHVWDYDFEGGSNVVDVYIRYLRKKVDDGFEKKLIQTVRGAGYVLKETL